MKRLYTSRKLWGALLGSLSIIGAVLVTPAEQIPAVIMPLGALWAAAISGQAFKDYKEAVKDGGA